MIDGVLHVVDYVGNEGGGVRFSVELLRAISQFAPSARVEVCSVGPALATYRGLLAAERVPYPCVELAPGRGTAGDWLFDVPERALDGADVVWCPWVHRHRLPPAGAERVVGSFHDAILFTDPVLRNTYARQLRDERRATDEWLASPARVVVSSHATVATLGAVFGAPPGRFDVVPLSGAHGSAAPPAGELPAAWSWLDERFLLCPANISPHKNHEGLLAGFAEWGARCALVLTGVGADLPVSRSPWKRQLRRALEPFGVLAPTRGTALRAAIRRHGLALGRDVIPLGYVADAVYYAVLKRAWALVMPTFAEGGGSFPVEEAMRAGVPVLCSDIPVMREHLGRLGGAVLWFDPRDPSALAARLAELAARYPDYKAQAVRQVATLRHRSWADVAEDYWPIFNAVASAPVAR